MSQSDQPSDPPASGRPGDRDAPAGNAPGATPAGLRAALAGVGLEALSLVAAAVVLVVELVAGGSDDAGISIFLVLFCLGIAAALVAAGRVLLAGRRGGRGPVLTWQAFQLVIGVSMVGADGWVRAGGVATIAVALAVAVLLMTPRVVAATKD